MDGSQAEKSRPGQGGFFHAFFSPHPLDWHVATINVYTYYTHKLAWEKARRQPVRRAPVHPVKVQLTCTLFGLYFGFCLGWLMATNLALTTLAGALGGRFCDWLLYRIRKVGQALSGRPLEADDLRSFRRHKF